MKYSELISVTVKAIDNKPSFGDPCNHCGWCCLTEVCTVGAELGGSTKIPCKYLKSEDGLHLCSLAGIPEIKTQLSMGEGCDAKTQMEQITEMGEF